MNTCVLKCNHKDGYQMVGPDRFQCMINRNESQHDYNEMKLFPGSPQCQKCRDLRQYNLLKADFRVRDITKTDGVQHFQISCMNGYNMYPAKRLSLIAKCECIPGHCQWVESFSGKMALTDLSISYFLQLS